MPNDPQPTTAGSRGWLMRRASCETRLGFKYEQGSPEYGSRLATFATRPSRSTNVLIGILTHLLLYLDFEGHSLIFL